MDPKLFFLALLLLASRLDVGHAEEDDAGGDYESDDNIEPNLWLDWGEDENEGVTTTAASTTTSVISTTTSPKEPTCNETGVWSDCLSLGISRSDSYVDCLKQCKNDSLGCTHFTFSGALCETFYGNDSIPCAGPDADEDCPRCVSGERTCVDLILQCDQNFCCSGKKLKTYYNVSSADCLVHCNDYTDGDCKWFSHYTEFNTCQLFADEGTHLHEGEGVCVSGQKGCPDPSEPKCGFPLVCDGIILESSFTNTAETCLKKCQDYEGSEGERCLWMSFHQPDRLCYFFDTCAEPFEADGNFLSGESQCQSLAK